MTPELGKRYVCRDKRISAVIEPNNDARRPFRCGEIPLTERGTCHLDDTEDGRDLMAEFLAEPMPVDMSGAGC